MIAIGSDHAGYQAKKEVVEYLEKTLGYSVKDFGTYGIESCDYPDFALPVCNAVVDKECEFGILICGTGVGMSIAANKVRGIRCAVCGDDFSTEMTRRHNDANVMAMGARIITTEKMCQLAKLFLTTPFEGGRHAKRVDKITKIEQENN